MAGLLVYMLYGERIMPRFEFDGKGFSFVGADGGGYDEEELNNENGDPIANPEENGDENANPPESDGTDAGLDNNNNNMQEGDGQSEIGTVQEPVTQPEEAASNLTENPPVDNANAPDYNQVRALPVGLSVSPFDFTVRRLGEVTHLTAAGNPTATRYSWVSQNPAIASVDQNGNVTANSNGVTTIFVTDGERKGECVVRVYSGNGNDSASANQLNRTDFTRYVSEGGYQLSVSGVDAGSLSWRSANPDVAVVSETGFVTPVAPGTATIIVSWGDQSRVCTVRVPSE